MVSEFRSDYDMLLMCVETSSYDPIILIEMICVCSSLSRTEGRRPSTLVKII